MVEEGEGENELLTADKECVREFPVPPPPPLSLSRRPVCVCVASSLLKRKEASTALLSYQRGGGRREKWAIITSDTSHLL